MSNYHDFKAGKIYNPDDRKYYHKGMSLIQKIYINKSKNGLKQSPFFTAIYLRATWYSAAARTTSKRPK
jgi:hypothetical protein